MTWRDMNRKSLAIGIILLFVGTSVIPVIAQDTEKPLPTSGDNRLYVGGSGPANYTRIQDAINNASDGDVVYVYDDSSPYKEFITVNRSITLVGENRNSTIVNCSSRNDIVILISAKNVTVQGFMLLGSAPSYGMMVNADNTTVADIKIQGLQEGIMVMSPDERSLVKDCLIHDCVLEADYGLYIDHAWNVTIRNNFFHDLDVAVALFFSFKCTVSSNLIAHSHFAIHTNFGANNKFIDNTIIACEEGIFLEATHEQIINNNFLNVTKPAYFYRHPWINFILIYEAQLYDEYEYNHVFAEEFKVYGPSTWVGNYWNEPRTQQYQIPGWRGDFFIMLAYVRNFPPTRVMVDSHPAQEPYDFPVVPS